MDHDADRTIVFSSSVQKHLVGIIIGVVMVSLSIFVLTVPSDQGGGVVLLGMRVAGGAGLVFFGFVLLVIVRRLLSPGGIVTLAPEGLRDVRIAPDFIPWSAVEGISAWGSGATAVMVLHVRPETEKALRLTRMARWTRSMNAGLGADGLCVALAGLDTDDENLLARTEAYWRAYR